MKKAFMLVCCCLGFIFLAVLLIGEDQDLGTAEWLAITFFSIFFCTTAGLKGLLDGLNIKATAPFFGLSLFLCLLAFDFMSGRSWPSSLISLSLTCLMMEFILAFLEVKKARRAENKNKS